MYVCTAFPLSFQIWLIIKYFNDFISCFYIFQTSAQQFHKWKYRYINSVAVFFSFLRQYANNFCWCFHSNNFPPYIKFVHKCVCLDTKQIFDINLNSLEIPSIESRGMSAIDRVEFSMRNVIIEKSRGFIFRIIIYGKPLLHSPPIRYQFRSL